MIVVWFVYPLRRNGELWSERGEKVDVGMVWYKGKSGMEESKLVE